MIPLRLVLDTNIWLDWLVFEDTGIAAIKVLVASRKAEIYVDAQCELELARVLAYPRSKTTLDSTAQVACIALCNRLARRASQSEELKATNRERLQLPKCRDPDDQKFLELARACGADFLITKDKALLELERRRSRATPFRIVTPRQFAAYPVT